MIQKRIIKTTTNPSNEHELAKSAEQILNDYRDTVVKVIRCYLNKQSCDELSCYSASISKKLVQNNNNGSDHQSIEFMWLECHI